MRPAQPIRLFADAHVFDGYGQGTRSFLLGLYRELAKDPAFEIFMGAVDMQRLSSCFGGSSIRFIQYPDTSAFKRYTSYIPGIIRKNSIDYAHFQYFLPPKKHCYSIATIHDVLFDDHPDFFSHSYRVAKHLLYRRTAKKADILTTVSTYSEQSIRKNLSPGNRRISIIPNAVSPVYFEAHDKNLCREEVRKKFGAENYILYVSRIEPRKNHAALLDAFLGMKNSSNYHLVFVGHSTIPNQLLEKKLEKLPYPERSRVHWLPDIDDADLLLLYRAATLFVYPSLAEGFGIPPLEAAASLTPVICSNRSSMADFDFFGQGHIDPSDKTQLSMSIEDYLEKPPAIKTLQKIADTIQEYFSWEKSADRFAKAILYHHSTKQDEHAQLLAAGR